MIGVGWVLTNFFLEMMFASSSSYTLIKLNFPGIYKYGCDGSLGSGVVEI